MRDFFASLTRDPVSLLGAAITTVSALVFLALFALELVGFHGNPYLGILAYLILPALFILGLLLIPVGVWRDRRRRRKAAEAGEAPPQFPVMDLNSNTTRRNVLIFLVLTIVNLVLLSAATYKGVETMESTEFCGQACHSVMEPEYTAYRQSPHARVGCVSCHIGPGAPWFVKSKLSGAWQVVSVNLDLYPRPIPTPIENLRPARETCEQCHWPVKFVGDRLKVLPKYQEDEENTLLKTVLLMKVGGVEGRVSEGIHWHVDPEVEIRYRSDPNRETIYEVEMTRNDGEGGRETVTFLPPEPAPEGESVELEWRVMDCVDCHNRPSHTFQPPEVALNEALADERLDPSLPWIRREGFEAITVEYPSHEAAREGITADLVSFYRAELPQVARSREADILAAAEILGDIYASNVFPTMDVEWGTYPNHIGHEQSPGCFRCHDSMHATEDGRVIEQDCFACHSLLAMEEQDPEILDQLQP